MSDDFGHRLKQARQKRNISLKKLAQAIYNYPATIIRYERGDLHPGAQNILMIADFLNVSVDWLMGLDDVQDIIEKNADPQCIISWRIRQMSKDFGGFDKLTAHMRLNTAGQFNSLTRWYSGESKPHYAGLRWLAERSGVSADWLLGLSDERKR